MIIHRFDSYALDDHPTHYAGITLELRWNYSYINNVLNDIFDMIDDHLLNNALFFSMGLAGLYLLMRMHVLWNMHPQHTFSLPRACPVVDYCCLRVLRVVICWCLRKNT